LSLRLPRRRFCLSFAVLALVMPGNVRARVPLAAGLDGTWAGVEQGETAQIIVSGGLVIGFFWRGDYLDPADARLSSDGRALSFRFPGGRATLRRTADDAAALEVSEGRGVTHFNLRRD
jgi:hypothetical protein